MRKPLKLLTQICNAIRVVTLHLLPVRLGDLVCRRATPYPEHRMGIPPPVLGCVSRLVRPPGASGSCPREATPHPPRASDEDDDVIQQAQRTQPIRQQVDGRAQVEEQGEADRQGGWPRHLPDFDRGSSSFSRRKKSLLGERINVVPSPMVLR